MVLQTLCLIDITGCMCRSLDKRAACSKLWKACQVVVAILVLGLWVIMAIVIFISHGRQEVSNICSFARYLGQNPVGQLLSHALLAIHCLWIFFAQLNQVQYNFLLMCIGDLKQYETQEDTKCYVVR